MAEKRTFQYDREADILYINTVTPYAEQESEELEDEIIARLNTEVNALLALPAVQESFGKLGLVPFPGTPAELGTIIKADLERWPRVVREAGIKPD